MWNKLFAMFLLFCIQSIANGQDFIIDTVELAAKEDKKTIIIFGADYCFWCHKLEKLIKEDQEVSKELSSYVILHLDLEKDEELAKKYKVKSVPAIFVLDENGEIEKKQIGFNGKNQFIKFLQDN